MTLAIGLLRPPRPAIISHNEHFVGYYPSLNTDVHQITIYEEKKYLCYHPYSLKISLEFIISFRVCKLKSQTLVYTAKQKAFTVTEHAATAVCSAEYPPHKLRMNMSVRGFTRVRQRVEVSTEDDGDGGQVRSWQAGSQGTRGPLSNTIQLRQKHHGLYQLHV